MMYWTCIILFCPVYITIIHLLSKGFRGACLLFLRLLRQAPFCSITELSLLFLPWQDLLCYIWVWRFHRRSLCLSVSSWFQCEAALPASLGVCHSLQSYNRKWYWLKTFHIIHLQFMQFCKSFEGYLTKVWLFERYELFLGWTKVENFKFLIISH